MQQTFINASFHSHDSLFPGDEKGITNNPQALKNLEKISATSSTAVSEASCLSAFPPVPPPVFSVVFFFPFQPGIFCILCIALSCYSYVPDVHMFGEVKLPPCQVSKVEDNDSKS